tara:strand:+ start:957 stop:1547 length:591 start_codon:yes stop_codon:yes gene_type:complete
MDIPNILDILQFLNLFELQLSTHVNKNFIENCLIIKKKLIQKFDETKDTFYPTDLSKVPVIKFSPSYLDEINYFRKVDVTKIHHPIVIGIDNFNRPFIIIKYQILYLNDTYSRLLFVFKKKDKLWSNTHNHNYIFQFERFQNTFNTMNIIDRDKYREHWIFGKNKSITHERIQKMFESQDVELDYHNNSITYRMNF